MTEPVNRTGFQWLFRYRFRCEIQFRSGRSLFIILLFTVHNQGGPYFSKNKSNIYTFVQPRGGGGGGVSIFSPKTQKCHVYFCTTKGGWVPKGPKSQKYVQMCIHVCTFVT